jgi:hypothetical protein
MRSLALCGLLFLAAPACSDDTKPVTVDKSVTPDKPVTTPDKPVTTPDKPVATPDKPQSTDIGPDKQMVDYNLTACNDPTALLNDALSKGTKVFKGLTSTTSSIPIADLLANMSSYTGKVVRIEGKIIEVCPIAGCYIRIKDKSGSDMVLKVDDGTLDFRDITRAGYYAVGEGIPTPTGDHGPQVYIQNHGAMIGTILCPVP